MSLKSAGVSSHNSSLFWSTFSKTIALNLLRLLLILAALQTDALAESAVQQKTIVRPKQVVAKLYHYDLHFGLALSIKEEAATAWCVNPECDVVITNYHTIKVAGPNARIKGVKIIEIVSATSDHDQDARVLPSAAGPMKVAPARDMALLTMGEPLVRKGMHSVPFYTGWLDPGQKITAIGFPGGKLQSIRGTFVQEHAEGLLQFDMENNVGPGISGSLVIDEQGKSVGLVVGFSYDHRFIYAVPVWSIADFIRQSKPQLYAALFTGELYRGKASGDFQGETEEPAVDVFAEDFPASLQEGINPTPVLPESYLLLNETVPDTPIERYNVSAAVLALRRGAQLMSDQMKNFVAHQTLLLPNGHAWQHELQVVDGRQRFRTIDGKDLFELPIKGGPVPGSEWAELVRTIGFNSSLAIQFEHDLTVENQAIKVFRYRAPPEDEICKLRIARSLQGTWKGSLSCTGAIWTDEEFRILRITQDMVIPPELGMVGFRMVVLYGWWGQRLVPVEMYIRSTTTGGKSDTSRAKFDDYRVFTATSKIVFLSDHPKPANEYHLKTGQREQRLGH